MPIIRAEELKRFSNEIFKAIGASEEEASIVSGNLVEANLAGHDSHGVIRISQYYKSVKEGLTVPQAVIEVMKETPVTAVVNGNWGFGQVIAKKSMEIAVEKAETHGLGAVAIRHCNHIGRLADYAILPVEKNMIGIIVTNSAPLVAPFGGLERVLSTNPICVGVPNGEKPYFLLDMATSARAEGKIRVRRNRNEKVPLGWLIDKEGLPTDDPNDLYEGGALLPFGGEVAYKAMGLGMIVDFLGGALTEAGCSSSEEYRSPGGSNGTFIIVINVAWFTSVDEFKRRTDQVISNVKNVKRQPGVDKIFVAGELEEESKKKRLEEGIFVSDFTWESIKSIAEENGLNVETYVKLD
jgi:uncharacterized oxidoreductase